MKQLLGSLALFFVALVGSGVAPNTLADQGTTKGKGKYQIVFHISENSPQQWQIALNNAMSFQRNLGKDNTQVEIVANGPGLNMLKLDGADLIGGVRVVPGGIIEIADRQRAGWSYIRP